jgi:hypothetical protein
VVPTASLEAVTENYSFTAPDGIEPVIKIYNGNLKCPVSLFLLKVFKMIPP